MNKYEKAKIYKIESLKGSKIYIGSTVNDYLSNRMAKHRHHHKDYKLDKRAKVFVSDIFDEYGVENCFITLIENYPCKDVDELRQREKHYIKTLDCVNRCIPSRTMKEYYLDNRETIKLASVNRYNEHKYEKYNCDCGVIMCFGGKSRHLKYSCKLNK